MADIDISPEKVAHIIVLARELDGKVGAWDTDVDEDDPDSVLEARANDPLEAELRGFIGELNVDEQVSLVALMWVGRGTYEPEDWDEAVDTARSERVNKTETYLLGVPMLSDYLEDGLDKMGISVEDAEEGILYPASALHLHITARCRFDGLKRAEFGVARRHFLARLLFHPVLPVRPPGTGMFLRTGQPVVQCLCAFLVGPVLVLADSGGLMTPAMWPEPATTSSVSPPKNSPSLNTDGSGAM
jgi:hypothetical protein